MDRLSLRNYRMKFKTSGEILTDLEKPMEYTLRLIKKTLKDHNMYLVTSVVEPPLGFCVLPCFPFPPTLNKGLYLGIFVALTLSTWKKGHSNTTETQRIPYIISKISYHICGFKNVLNSANQLEYYDEQQNLLFWKYLCLNIDALNLVTYSNQTFIFERHVVWWIQ